MLIRFEVENYRSIAAPMELSMVAIDRDRPEVRGQERLGEGLLTAAGIFGPNAAGKSNMLAALFWLRRALQQSVARWDEGIPVEPFAADEYRRRDSSFALELAVQGVRFEYLLDVSRERVGYEALFHYPKGARRRIFERNGNNLELQRGLGVLGGARALLVDRSLALALMRRFDEPLTSSFAQALLQMVSLGQSLTGFRRLPSGRMTSMGLFDVPTAENELSLFFELEDEQEAWLSERRAQRTRAMSLLQLADLGISDVVLEEVEIPGREGSGDKARQPRMVHTLKGHKVSFEYRDESAGTKAWFELIGPVLAALQRGSIVLFDELDASLHPTLTAQVIGLFHGMKSNPYGAQLVFTSHDTNLLNHLGRDQVWLAQKSEGATEFAPLSHFAGERVRRSANLETGYLSGRFGGLPDVNRPNVLRQLGLIG